MDVDEWNGGWGCSYEYEWICHHGALNSLMWPDFYVNNSMVSETLIDYFVLIPPFTGNSALQKQSKSEKRKKKEKKKKKPGLQTVSSQYLMETSASGFPGSSPKVLLSVIVFLSLK